MFSILNFINNIQQYTYNKYTRNPLFISFVIVVLIILITFLVFRKNFVPKKEETNVSKVYLSLAIWSIITIFIIIFIHDSAIKHECKKEIDKITHRNIGTEILGV